MLQQTFEKFGVPLLFTELGKDRQKPNYQAVVQGQFGGFNRLWRGSSRTIPRHLPLPIRRQSMEMPFLPMPRFRGILRHTQPHKYGTGDGGLRA